jgi:hypothetical protein
VQRRPCVVVFVRGLYSLVIRRRQLPKRRARVGLLRLRSEVIDRALQHRLVAWRHPFLELLQKLQRRTQILARTRSSSRSSNMLACWCSAAGQRHLREQGRGNRTTRVSRGSSNGSIFSNIGCDHSTLFDDDLGVDDVEGGKLTHARFVRA